MNIYPYCNQRGENLIEKYINKLTMDEQVDAFDVLRQLQNGEFNTLNIKRWQGKIMEVYFYKHNRLFLVLMEKENIYLLHACKKQKNKTERKDSKIVLRRAKEILKELK